MALWQREPAGSPNPEKPATPLALIERAIRAVHHDLMPQALKLLAICHSTSLGNHH